MNCPFDENDFPSLSFAKDDKLSFKVFKEAPARQSFSSFAPIERFLTLPGRPYWAATMPLVLARAHMQINTSFHPR
jgi:hypothetical protein